MKTIYLAGGCFWGAQKFFDQFDGVKETQVGFANGNKDSVRYEEIKNTGHAETVKVVYDEEKLPTKLLLRYYFLSIDPLSVNKQGEDSGIQYRTGIYYENESDISDIFFAIKAESSRRNAELAVEVEKLLHFCPAEESHQKYLEKNPTGYCHIKPALLKLFTLKNKNIAIAVSAFGAELKSLCTSNGENEYLWYADSKYWGRSAPVLFPLVGNYKDKNSLYNGRKYTLGQHGFARDKMFELAEKTENTLAFRLQYSENTLNVYPFKFRLEVKYTLLENKVCVDWSVKNLDDKTMYFSLGGHPAFLCNLNENFLRFDSHTPLVWSVLNSEGLLSEEKCSLPLEDSVLSLSSELFDKDAIILENNQIHSVQILDKNKISYLQVDFKAPVLGIWSPAKKNAQFVCIEPWYGRTDRATFSGELPNREWGNALSPQKEFIGGYTIQI